MGKQISINYAITFEGSDLRVQIFNAITGNNVEGLQKDFLKKGTYSQFSEVVRGLQDA